LKHFVGVSGPAKLGKSLLKFFLWHRVLITNIHVGSIHYGKATTTRAAATLGIDFQGHFIIIIIIMNKKISVAFSPK